jgi:hypothetical protein
VGTDLRIAAAAVGLAIAGTAAVLVCLPPARSPVAGRATPLSAVSPSGEVAGARTERARLPGCPPCRGGPLDPGQWRARLEGPPGGWDAASALSLALPDEGAVAQALVADDPAQVELATLLLNVASGRVAGCTPLDGEDATAIDVLDGLDRLVAGVLVGRPVPARDLATAVSAAQDLNRGVGLSACWRGGPPADAP